MGIKQIVKTAVPAPLWEYLRHKKAAFTEAYAMKECMSFAENLEAFFVLDSLDYYNSTGKIFNGEQYYSQACQDYFIDNFIFRRKQGGFFLDIGGNDPAEINNTYFFEKNRGWSGLAFEPMTAQREKWKSSRKTECLPCALGSTSGEAEFCEYEAHAMSGFSHDVDFTGKIKKRYRVPVRRLSDILGERGIKHVDFVSLDVEGAEIEVLHGIDFSRVTIDCFTIENNKGWRREHNIRKFMRKAGYKIKAKLWLDEVWVKA